LGDSIWFEGQESDYPSPDDVRKHAGEPFQDATEAHRPDPVRYPDQNLIVKWGTFVDIIEGQCIWFLQNRMADTIPVPKIYGWKRDGKQVFLYLELVKGSLLEERWPELKQRERRAVCRELRRIVRTLQRIQAPRDYAPLCGISGGPLRDITFEESKVDSSGEYVKGNHNDTTGPHATVSAFHDALAKVALKRPENYSDPRKEIEELSGFDDQVPIVFAHADLAKSNIILSEAGDGPCRLVAIIDWHQAGWYPQPWEYLKAALTDVYDSEWVRVWLPQFLERPEFAYERSYDYVSMATI
jgi:hypothetical protein